MMPALLILLLTAPAAMLDKATWPPALPVAEATNGQQTTLPSSISGSQDAEGLWNLQFMLDAGDEVSAAALAGNFNHWSRSATPMHQREDGIWIVDLSLPDGTWWYKFVLDAEVWRADPLNQLLAPDGHGGNNSVLRLGPEANLDASLARLGDGHIDAGGLAHDPDRVLYYELVGEQQVKIRLRTLAHDVQEVQLYQRDIPPTSLNPILSNDQFQWWETVVPFQNGLPYTFVLRDDGQRQQAPQQYVMSDTNQAVLTTPDWVRDVVWYQIMIDRFCNGSDRNNPDPMRPWTSSWYGQSPWEGTDGQTFYEYFVFDRRYGGDLQGLRSKLDYLKELGVDALYLNPVFQAESLHKYNATSYIHIDEEFGAGNDYTATEQQEDLLDPTTWIWNESDRLFLEFLKEAKARGFRVIIDGVFNHVGVNHPAFQDVLKNGESSRFADWFQINSWDPIDYEGWGGFKSLPVFRKDDEHGIASAEVREHIMHITRRWMDPDGDGDPSDGIDGWRLDVPNEVPRPFWVEWRKVVKSINPDAYITGEIWDRADEWLDGETFDAVMNYPFAEHTLAWIGNREKTITPTELDQRLAELRMAYPDSVTYVMQNLLDSHDTDRLVSKIHNPDRPYDEGNREQDDDTYDGSKPSPEAYQRTRLAALIQLMYVGTPMIYYGDEVGIWGSDDPNNRKPMIWPELEPFEDPEFKLMPEHLNFYQQAIAVRQNSPAIRRGDFQTVHLHDDNNTWAFTRSMDGEEILVAISPNEHEQDIDLTSLGDGWELLMVTPATDALDWPMVKMPPLSAAVWRRMP
ncbi:MAG: alpha-amylase family glycosyl hydrolase [Phycisphaerales bacterium]|nr:alpha-amylase family glycosyl hydrolase [Phycisphaerales bacterium]